MGDKFKKVQAGQDLQIPAEVWNTLLDMAQRDKQQKHNILSNPTADFRQSGVIKLRNASGQPLDAFSILELSAPIIAPLNNLNEFKRQVALDGVLPSPAARSRFAITLQPLAAGRIGLAVAAGVIAVKVLVESASYPCAEPIEGTSSHLRCVAHGPASILWMESTGASRWAIVRIDESNQEEMVLVTSNQPDSEGYYSGVVQRYDVTSRRWISQFACKVLDANR